MKAKAMAMFTAMFALMMTVSALGSTPTGIEALSTSMTTELNTLLPQLATAAGSVIGAIAPIALTIAGMVAVV